MCYQLTKQENGGWHYTMTISSLTISGWRKGNKGDVETYIKHASQNCEIRAVGGVPHRGRDGTIHSGLTEKRGKKNVRTTRPA